MRQFTTSCRFATGGSASFATVAVISSPRQLMIRSVMYFGCSAVRKRACTADAISGDTCTFAAESSPVTVNTLSPRLSTVSHGDAGLAATSRFISLSIMVFPPHPDSSRTALTASTFLITFTPHFPRSDNLPLYRHSCFHECEGVHRNALRRRPRRYHSRFTLGRETGRRCLRRIRRPLAVTPWLG